jgi:hypothetical protein
MVEKMDGIDEKSVGKMYDSCPEKNESQQQSDDPINNQNTLINLNKKRHKIHAYLVKLRLRRIKLLLFLVRTPLVKLDHQANLPQLN